MRSVRFITCTLLAAALVSASVSFAAAKQEKSGNTPTVEWYMAPENNDALHEKLSYCNNIRGEKGNTEDCNNARLAGRKLRKLDDAKRK